MKTFSISSCLVSLAAGVLASPSLAQNIPVNSPAESLSVKSPQALWTLSTTASEESVGHGLPVLALGRSDWPAYQSDPVGRPGAWRSIRAELGAISPGGWRMAGLVRYEASLDASPDSVALAAQEAGQTRPAAARHFAVSLHSQGWQGHGIKLGTPWFKLGSAGLWELQADAQLLRLRQLKFFDLSGVANYQGAGTGGYDFNLQSERANAGITGPFLAPSGRTGLGASLSVALQGEPAPGWRLQMRADDLLSHLQVPDLATDSAVLNSQVTSRAPDGSLDYGPVVKGKKELQRVTRKVGAHWQAKVSWRPLNASADMATLRLDRKARIDQVWLGWESGDTALARFQWRLELEPLRRAIGAGVMWGGWKAALATDGKGTGSQLRALRLGYQVTF